MRNTISSKRSLHQVHGDKLKEQELWLFEELSFSYVLTKEVGLALAPNGVVMSIYCS